MACEITDEGVFRADVCCPCEKLKQRIGVAAMVLGGLDLSATATEKKRDAEKVRSVIKRLDAKNRHPLEHLRHFPDDVSEFEGDRFQMAGFVDDPPADISPSVEQIINSLLVENVSRSTNLLVTPRKPTTLQLDVAPRTPNTQNMPMMQAQDMLRMQQMMCMQMMGAGGMPLSVFGSQGTAPPRRCSLQHCS